MSTKTTFKRIALVVVSALGFGMLGAVTPANAADTASFSVPVTSVTVITPASSYDSSNANGAIFKIVLRNFGATKTSQSLQTNEALTAQVVGVPAGTGSAKTLAANGSDLQLVRVAPNTETTVAGNPYSVTSRHSFTPAETAAAGGTLSYDPADPVYYETTTGDFQNTYYLRVVPTPGATVINQGEYTIRLRLTANSGALLVQDTSVKVNFVSSPIGAGFTLTAAAVGNYRKGEAALSTYAATKYLSATLRDANGGRVVSETTAGTVAVPALTADLVDADSVQVNTPNGALTANDGGATSDFGITSSSTTDAANQAKGNGVYGITAAAGWLDTVTATPAGGTTTLRVRYADKTATAALTVLDTANSGTASVSVSATGLSVLSTAPNWDVPLTTTSVRVTVSGATAGNAVVFTPTWSGAVASGDVSPTSATAQTVYADASGVASLTLTNAAPQNGGVVTVAISGFSAAVTSQVITWRASAAHTMSVSLDGAVVALKSSNTFVATVTDRFGAPVAGVVLLPSVSTTGSNGSATRTYTAVTTGANGQASYTLTDALAVAAGTDTVTFAHSTSGTAIASASSTITYAATAPAPTTLTVFSNSAGTATQTIAGVSNPVPTTGIYKTGTTEFDVVEARNNTRPIATSSSDLLTLRVRALKGAAVTATASTGAYILGAANLAVTSRTLYGNADGDVFFIVGSNKTGANTISFTSGTATASAAFWAKNSTSDARFVTLTGPATASANGEPGNYKVSVTDRYGNPISGAQLSIAATGVAAFGGGATLQTYTTGASGEFTFTGTSFLSAGGAGAFKVDMTNTTGADVNSAAGFVGTTAVESTLAAGNSSATLNVTFAAGVSAAQAAADAAADAAAEAIDAANAATDAANLAAEAADAATVAAEEARDAADAATAAVEELATQVATLMAALKAQITTLANTVAKIAKKVRA